MRFEEIEIKGSSTNKEWLYRIRAYALWFEYWSKLATTYYSVTYYSYAPMIKDELFYSLFDTDAIVGAKEVEEALGRTLKIEELIACPCSVEYLLFGNPIITESEDEAETLSQFAVIIKDAIRKGEVRAIGNKIKKLQARYDLFKSRK